MEDPAIAELRISGIHHSGGNAGSAEMIARLHGLRALRQGDGIRLVAPSAATRH
ncbi:MAG TPA: hypothetical protein VK325_04160 [Pseudoxanthomonas sp.]|nr:hypothetical protein [Pseudoxanthomonas sp.]